MAAKNVICKGDLTSHGGTVIGGIDSYPIFGRAVACKGHMVVCPLCKGIFPISEGVSSHTIEGKHPAVEGMKTACGAKLIALQTQYKIDE